MTIDEAIHAAIAGGWDFKKAEVGGILTTKAAFMDPDFWESLGKTLGWDALNDVTLHESGRVAWHQMWVNFIDDLAHGKPADEFFQKLTLQ
jgi:hypothetical protein